MLDNDEQARAGSGQVQAVAVLATPTNLLVVALLTLGLGF